ncbi:YhgE/Pip domain-containing protein [Streptomyces sp. ME18-1-4]|uniref:YhgE/Pip domain-containing protein n=1 Tax=Streptomyces sp. ME18-1-4 TaxID=3028685 RepID=UPI0029BCECEC|nr:DUF3533 domain-containing protein [Streptomyces sp. ME18-1-4]MDX3245867.1 DUF3533 domain-containing protein [Streptomyces sp. ME18-1-4]
MSDMHPFRLLRARPLWIANGVVTGVLALLFAVFYVGANIDPVDHLTKLPVGLVDADKGAVLGGERVDLGAQITESIEKSTASGDKIDWKVMGEKEMRRGDRPRDRCSFSQIAVQVGLREQSSLTRAVRRWFATSPSRLRRAASDPP